MDTRVQDAYAHLPAATDLDFASEIIVFIDVELQIQEYIGTRAALEADGILPIGVQWPEKYTRFDTEDEHHEYTLIRHRPKGLKGSRNHYADMDYWALRIEPKARKPFYLINRERKTQAAAALIHEPTPQERAAWTRQFNACRAAARDEKYQAFKAKIPGLIKKRRGRSAKSIAKENGHV